MTRFQEAAKELLDEGWLCRTIADQTGCKDDDRVLDAARIIAKKIAGTWVTLVGRAPMTADRWREILHRWKTGHEDWQGDADAMIGEIIRLRAREARVQALVEAARAALLLLRQWVQGEEDAADRLEDALDALGKEGA